MVTEVKIIKPLFAGEEYILNYEDGLSKLTDIKILSFFDIPKNIESYYEFIVYNIISLEEKIAIAKIETSCNGLYGSDLVALIEKQLIKIVTFPYTTLNNLLLKINKTEGLDDYIFKFILSYEKEE